MENGDVYKALYGKCGNLRNVHMNILQNKYSSKMLKV